MIRIPLKNADNLSAMMPDFCPTEPMQDIRNGPIAFSLLDRIRLRTNLEKNRSRAEMEVVAVAF